MATQIEMEGPLAAEMLRAAELLGGKATFRKPLTSALDAHEIILTGLPGKALTSLYDRVALVRRADTLEKAVGISLRTLQRRKKDAPAKPLSTEQSGRAWKFAELLAKATRIFGSQEEAERWFEAPAVGLSQHRPIDLLSTPAGVELVEDHLERIAFGVYA
jgi:putative toxin-antitoxin system antitoxin component (TIGR02293 family)